MQSFAFDHLEDHSLLDGTRSLRSTDRLTTALLIARIGEIDSRRLCETIGYSSTFAWCVIELQYSEDEACRRISAARHGHRYPQLFEALADGRLHLTAVNLIGPHLTQDTADEWIAAATHKTRAEIQTLIALRRPRPDGPDGMVELAGYVLDQVRDRMLPTAPQRLLFQCAIGETLRAMFEEARCLMSHQNPSGNYEAVLIEALELLIPALKKQKFATTGTGERKVPAALKEQVWERDGGSCVYTGEYGRRCGSTWQVEFDHVVLVARGGRAITAKDLRCLCRGHNQLEAERVLGAGFMEEKRQEAKAARQASRMMKSAARAGADWIVTETERVIRAGADWIATETDEAIRAGADRATTESGDKTGHAAAARGTPETSAAA